MTVEQLALFPKAMVATPRPVEPILRSAEIEGDYRFVLRRVWGGGPCLGIVMLNPSTADHEKDDPTLWECMKHACRLGFGSIVITNLYPFRSPSVPELMVWLHAKPRSDIMLANDHRACSALNPCDKIMFAWGNHAPPERVRHFIGHLVMKLVDDTPEEPGPEIFFYCLGTNANGSPRHPLARGSSRIPVDQRLEVWRQ